MKLGRSPRSAAVALAALAALAGCGSHAAGPASGRDAAVSDTAGAAADTSSDGDAAGGRDANPDQAVTADAGAAPDAGGDAGPAPEAGDGGDRNDSADAGEDAAGRVLCGSSRASLANTTFVESLVVGPDGTIYFSRGRGVSRLRPGLPQEDDWARFSDRVLGMTYDPQRRIVYAGMHGTIQIAAISSDEPSPSFRMHRVMGGGVYGLTMGEDGAVYYTDQWNGSVYRMTADGASTMVLTGIPNRPNGLAFGPDGSLYLNQSTGPDVWRVKLDPAGQELAREKFATVGQMGGGGIAFDALGRLYVTAADQLFQFDPAGKVMTSVPSWGNQIDFGAGVLSCSDLYVGGAAGLQVIPVHARGMDVPWHRVAPAP